MQCPTCNAKIPDNSYKCPNCGAILRDTPLEPATQTIKQVVKTFKFCPNCGTKLEPGTHFCPNCGTPVTTILPVPAVTTKSKRTSTVQTTIQNDSPEGADWIAIILVVFAACGLAWAAFMYSPIIGLFFLSVLGFNFKTFEEGLFHKNIFAPMMIHFTWGLIVGYGSFAIFASYLGDLIHEFAIQLIPILYALVCIGASAVYYVGFRLICSSYPKSRPQGKIVQLLFMLFLFLCAIFVRKNSTDSSSISTATSTTSDFSSIADSTTATATTIPDSSQVVAPDISQAAVSSSPSTMTVPDITNAATISDSSQVTLPDSSSMATSDPSQIITVTDSLNQPLGTATTDSSGVTTFTNAAGQYAGTMFSSGWILDSLGMPDGRIDGNTIYGANGLPVYNIDQEHHTISNFSGQTAYTIEGDTLYNAKHRAIATFHK